MEIIAGCVLLLTIALIFGRRAAANLMIGGLYLAGGIIVLLAAGLGILWISEYSRQQNEKAAIAQQALQKQQAQIEEEVRDLPPDKVELVAKFLQLPEHEQHERLSKVTPAEREHAVKFIEEFKVRQQLLKGLSTPSQN
jgi:hypothetical protein